MQNVRTLVQAISVLAAAAILGNWYLKELHRLKKAQKPWYTIYFSLPGILIIAFLFILPIVARYV